MQPQSMQDDGFTQMTGAVPVEHLSSEARGRFILLTYLHLLGAVVAFVALEVAIFATGAVKEIVSSIGGIGCLLFLGGFILVSHIASRVAHTVRSKPLQYLALAAMVVVEAIIFAPLLMFAQIQAAEQNYPFIQYAAATTLIGFLGLTFIVFGLRKDFSFMRGILIWGSFVALGVIIASIFLGFELGTVAFSCFIALAGGWILYDTSNVMSHYQEDRYIAASLELFVDVAMMFWWVLRLFMSRD